MRQKYFTKIISLVERWRNAVKANGMKCKYLQNRAIANKECKSFCGNGKMEQTRECNNL